jgi:hypothetical protein
VEQVFMPAVLPLKEWALAPEGKTGRRPYINLQNFRLTK